MNKKILLLAILFVVIIVLPTAKASAATINTYIGVKIASASAPVQNGTNSNWCLSGGYNNNYGTKITIMGGTNCAVASNGSAQTNCSTLSAVAGSNSANPNVAGSPIMVCPGSNNYIWSGLVSLNTDTNYVIKLDPQTFCPGMTAYGYGIINYYGSYSYGAICYVASSANTDCSATCSNYGLTLLSSNCMSSNTFSDCKLIEGLRGSSCGSNCFPNSNYNYYDTSTGNCYYDTSPTNTSHSCGALGATSVRACTCNVSYAASPFYFSYRTPSSF